MNPRSLAKDLLAGLVVFLVALPLCLGIAHASHAPLLSGLVAGIVGGLVVSLLSGSHTSVTGPAAGLTAVVLSQIASLGSFEAFLCAVLVCGLVQICMGAARLGALSLFIPSAVIKGLLAAIGLILILKQVPHALGHDPDWEGDFAFLQEDGQNTFTEIVLSTLKLHPGAALIGMICLAAHLAWDKRMKKGVVPAPLVVVALGVALKALFDVIGGAWEIGASHLVEVPTPSSLREWTTTLKFPDFKRLLDPAIWIAGATLAAVASLETLLNLEAVDRLDPKRRTSPPNRELAAQGVGNLISGLLGGLPVTSVIVRGSVNIQSGGQTRLAAFFHGAFLLGSVLLAPGLLNQIPLSALAAVLVAAGLKLAAPELFRSMWREGWTQFLPFAATVAAILLTDLLIGVLIGLCFNLLFILRSNYRHPFFAHEERHLNRSVLRLKLANQVTFLNKGALVDALHRLPEGSAVLLDARAADHIDPDVLDLLHEFRDHVAPARGINLSMVGFKPEHGLEDRVAFAYVATRELQQTLTPADALQILREGNDRFANDQRLRRSLLRQAGDTAAGQYPLAVILSCIDSRTSAELIFDLGLGDVFSIRIAGNVAKDKVLASIEYACLAAGAKLILVLGHTGCGAVKAACAVACGAPVPLGCTHLDALLHRIGQAVARESVTPPGERTEANPHFVDRVARLNVAETLRFIRAECPPLRERIDRGELGLVGGLYDIRTGRVEFFGDQDSLGFPQEADRTMPAERMPTHS